MDTGEVTSARTQELRAHLDAIVSEAERLSEQIVAESRATAAAVTRESEERAAEVLDRARVSADAIRAQAEQDVEEHRRRVRAEVSELVRAEVAEQNRQELAGVRNQAQAVIGDLEASVRILGVTLESAVTNIAEMLTALEELRTHVADPPPGDGPGSGAGLDNTGSDLSPGFTADAPPRTVPAPPSVFDDAGSSVTDALEDPLEDPLQDRVVVELDAGPDHQWKPRTATEAYLLSRGLAPEPSQVTELRAVRGPARDDDPAAEPEAVADEPSDETGTRPLGWLFRSTS